MLRVNEGQNKHCMRMILCATLLLLANMLFANEIVLGDGDVEESSVSPVRISVVTGSEEVSYPAIWGNYVVWKGTENEVYAIDQNALIPMPGLKIDGVPAIWENIVVWEGSRSFYNLDTQTLESLNTISIGSNPAISCGKIVWDNSLGFYDLDLGTMVYPDDLQIGDSPDIGADRIVWSGSQGYYDIGKGQMMQPRGLDVGLDPAIHGQRITWSYLKGGYYDVELETYGHARIIAGKHPDIFANRLLWLGGIGSNRGPTAVWEQSCGTHILNGQAHVNSSQIYGNLVVWDLREDLIERFFISCTPGCCGDEDHPYPEGDVNHDCRVDFEDLVLLTSRWLEDTGAFLGPAIKVTTRLDKAVYGMNDDMGIIITVSNSGSEAVSFMFRDHCQVSVRIDGKSYPADDFFDCLPAMSRFILPPGKSRTWKLVLYIEHSWYPLEAGTHSIAGVVLGYAESDMIEFEVLAE